MVDLISPITESTTYHYTFQGQWKPFDSNKKEIQSNSISQILPPYLCRERERKRNELLRNIQWSIDSGPTSGHHDLLHVSIPYHHIYGNERLDFLEHLIVPHTHTHTQIRLTHAISSHLIHVIWLIWILQHRFYLSLSFFVQGFISLCFFLLLSKLFWAIKSLMCFCESQK